MAHAVDHGANAAENTTTGKPDASKGRAAVDKTAISCSAEGQELRERYLLAARGGGCGER